MKINVIGENPDEIVDHRARNFLFQRGFVKRIINPHAVRVVGVVAIVPARPLGVARRGHPDIAAAVIDRIRPALFGITGAVVFPTAPPAISGLREFGGFTVELQDRGGHSLNDFATVTQNFMAAAPGGGRDGCDVC